MLAFSTPSGYNKSKGDNLLGKEITMKCTTVIDKDRPEECIVYAKTRTPLVCDIEALCQKEEQTFVGSTGADLFPFEPQEITAFTVENGKVFAVRRGERLRISERLYTLEERLTPDFIKINQSCLINKKRIERFSATVGGSLAVICKDGFRDIISRRQLKEVKERMGLKK